MLCLTTPAVAMELTRLIGALPNATATSASIPMSNLGVEELKVVGATGPRDQRCKMGRSGHSLASLSSIQTEPQKWWNTTVSGSGHLWPQTLSFRVPISGLGFYGYASWDGSN